MLAAAAELTARFGSALKGLLVQPMADPGPELLVGVTSDPVFGPLVTIGLGGTSTDLVVDRAHRLVPLTDVDAAEMLGEFRAGARLFDSRRSPTPDRSAVLDVVDRVGRLAETLPEVVELDLNPVVLGPTGCVIVDARIRVVPAPAAIPRCARSPDDTRSTKAAAGRVGTEVPRRRGATLASRRPVDG